MQNSFIPEEYIWLLDFCGYYKGETEDDDPFRKKLMELEKTSVDELSPDLRYRLQDSSIFWFYESCWVQFTINRQCGLEYCEEYIQMGLEDFLYDNSTPMTLKALLHNRYFHWNEGYGRAEDFKRWYLDTYEKYREKTRQEQLDNDSKHLNLQRLKHLMDEADKYCTTFHLSLHTPFSYE